MDVIFVAFVLVDSLMGLDNLIFFNEICTTNELSFFLFRLWLEYSSIVVCFLEAGGFFFGVLDFLVYKNSELLVAICVTVLTCS